MLSLLFMPLIFSPLAFNLAAWWRFTRANTTVPAAYRREMIARVGLMTNSVAIAIVWALFLYNFTFVQPSSIDAVRVWQASFVTGTGSVVLGAMSPQRVRIPLVLAGLSQVCFLIMLAGSMAVL